MLHLFSTKVAFMCSKLHFCAYLTAKDLTQPIFRLRGQKSRFSALPPQIEFGHCRTWLQL